MANVQLTQEAITLLATHNKRIIQELKEALAKGRVIESTRPPYHELTYGQELYVRQEAQLELEKARA